MFVLAFRLDPIQTLLDDQIVVGSVWVARWENLRKECYSKLEEEDH